MDPEAKSEGDESGANSNDELSTLDLIKYGRDTMIR